MREKNIKDYSFFHEFIDLYGPSGFQGINRNDQLILQLEKMMENNDQFFYIADTIQMKIIYTSNRSIQMIGIPPEELTFYPFMELTHPEDKQRLSLGRTKILKKSQDIFFAEEGTALLSTNFRMRNPDGKYSNILTQNYLFYSEIPYKTVFFLKIHTKIDWYRKLTYGYHFYVGSDMSFFRYPDATMLRMGNLFSKREFEIIKLIVLGYSSEQIAEELFLSIYTINTHRRNILIKSGKTKVSDLIYELKERGIL